VSLTAILHKKGQVVAACPIVYVQGVCSVLTWILAVYSILSWSSLTSYYHFINFKNF